MRGRLEFPKGAHIQCCLIAQPARLALPCPQPPCPPAQRRLAAFPGLCCSRGHSCKALTGQYPMCFGPCSGLSGDPFPTLTNCHTLGFRPDLCCHTKCCLRTLMLWGTLTGGHWFHCVCGSPQPQEVEKSALKVRKKAVNHNSSKLLFTNTSLCKDFFYMVICEITSLVSS